MYINYIVILLVIIYIECSQSLNQPLGIGQLMDSFGYPYENHTVQTTDGYLLKVFRIPGKKNWRYPEPKTEPILLVHGFLCSSKDFVMINQDSLALMLADAGYDVWLANLRSSEYSGHTRYAKEENAYWEFSIDEHAVYDVPETIDYVLRSTASDRIIYIGYSLANTIYIMMLNERPDLQNKIAISIAMSSAYFTWSSSVVKFFNGLMKGLNLIGFNHWYRAFPQLILNLCGPRENMYWNPCYLLYSKLLGDDVEQMRQDNLDLIFGRRITFSYKQMFHYLRIVEVGALAKYDHGSHLNLKYYNTKYPPSYSWRVSKAPLFIYSGEADYAYSKTDRKKISGLLKESKSPFYWKNLGGKKFRNFAHCDFISSKNYTKLLNEDVLKTLRDVLK